MKKNEMILAEMSERKSKYGRIYFEGVSDSDGIIVMQKMTKKKNARGEQVWKLFLTNR